MRAYPYKLKHLEIRLPVDKYNIRFDMTITMVIPITNKRMIMEFYWQSNIGNKEFKHPNKACIQKTTSRTFQKPFEIVLKLVSPLNRPHVDLLKAPLLN